MQQQVLELKTRHEKTWQKQRSWDTFQHIGFMKCARRWPCIQKSSKQEKANGKLIAKDDTVEEEEIVCPLVKVGKSRQCRTDFGKSVAGRNRERPDVRGQTWHQKNPTKGNNSGKRWSKSWKIIYLQQEHRNGVCEKLSNVILRMVQKPGAEACQQEQRKPRAFPWKAATERHMFFCSSTNFDP